MPTGTTPGNNSPTVDNTTPVSPNSGNTCEIYSKNAEFGPKINTPVRDKNSRHTYNKYAARCNATAVFPVPGPPSTTITPRLSSRIITSCSR